MENNENKIAFSWAYTFWGVFGYFFHRKNIEKRPFRKCAGVDIIMWGIIIGFFSKITSIICSQTTALDFIHSLFMMAIWGFVGAWRFNKYKKSDYDEDLFKKREKISIITGIIMLITIFGAAFGYGYYTSKIENTIDNVTYIYYENGYVCDKYFEVNANHVNVETNKDVERAVYEIHSYCPSDVYRTDTVDVKTIIEVYPQLTNWDFNAHFIHTYPTENGKTAYIFLKKVNVK